MVTRRAAAVKELSAVSVVLLILALTPQNAWAAPQQPPLGWATPQQVGSSRQDQPEIARQEGTDPTITVLWSENPITVGEGDGTVELPITVRVDGMAPPGTYESGGVTYEGRQFSVSSKAGTATSFNDDDNEGDYLPLSERVRLPAGSFTLQASGYYEADAGISITIIDDAAAEGIEVFEIVAQMAPGEAGVALPTDRLTVVLVDNDGRVWPPPDFCPTHPDTAADTSTPLIVEVGGSVEGDFCGKDDADWVQVTLAAGQAYRIEGAFDGTDGERPIRIAAMHDPDGQLITGTHSFEGNPYGTSNTSGYINFRPTETGTHYIEVGNMRWYHFEDATAPLGWRIEVNEVDLPPDDVSDVLQLTQEFNNYGQLVAAFDGTINTHGDRDTYAIDVVLGHQYFVQMHTRNGSGIFNCIHRITPEAAPESSTGSSTFGCQYRPGWKAYLWFTARHEGRYLITVGSHNGTGDYQIQIRDRNAVPPGVWDTPLPDDDIGQDTSTTGLIYINDSWLTGTAVTGEIDLAGDKDWFRVELEGNRRYQIDIRGEGSGVGTLRISYVWIHDANGERLIDANGGGNSFFDTRLVWTPPTSGTYFIQVAGSQYEIGTYDLSVIDLEDLYTTHRPS